MWKPYASMDYAQYGGTPYLSNHNFGWSYHPNTSWNTSYTTFHTPQVQRSSLEEKMAQLDMLNWSWKVLNFQDQGLKWTILKLGCDQNEKSQPPHKGMTKLKATMVELERVCAE